MVDDPFKAENTLEKHAGDLDLSFDSHHHTIGHGSTQAAAGNHKHSAAEITGAVTDHGGLGGLFPDDDHPQYPTTGGGRAYGTWGINITGNAETVDGQNFAHADRGELLEYMWGVKGGQNGDNRLMHIGQLDARYAGSGHGHTADVHGSLHGPYTVPANSTGTAYTVPHGLGQQPTACTVQALDDTGVQSIICSITTWDTVNLYFLARNMGGAETVRFSVIAART